MVKELFVFPHHYNAIISLVKAHFFGVIHSVELKVLPLPFSLSPQWGSWVPRRLFLTLLSSWEGHLFQIRPINLANPGTTQCKGWHPLRHVTPLELGVGFFVIPTSKMSTAGVTVAQQMQLVLWHSIVLALSSLWPGCILSLGCNFGSSILKTLQWYPLKSHHSDPMAWGSRPTSVLCLEYQIQFSDLQPSPLFHGFNTEAWGKG